MASVHQYGDHRAGSAKGKVHEVFDKTKGDREAAVKKAVSLGIKDTTARSWCSQFAADKPAKKAAPAKSAKKAAPAKKTTKKAPAKKAKRESLEAA